MLTRENMSFHSWRQPCQTTSQMSTISLCFGEQKTGKRSGNWKVWMMYVIDVFLSSFSNPLDKLNPLQNVERNLSIKNWDLLNMLVTIYFWYFDERYLTCFISSLGFCFRKITIGVSSLWFWIVSFCGFSRRPRCAVQYPSYSRRPLSTTIRVPSISNTLTDWAFTERSIPLTCQS